MLVDIDFTSHHVFVFGGTSGINLGVAEAFAQRGARVSVASRNPGNVQAACERLSAWGGQVHGVCADVRDYDAVGRAFAESVERFGPLDVLVSGAAGNFLCEAKDLSAGGFKVVVDIDLLGGFHVLRQAYAHLRKPGAAVINIGAPQSYVPMPYQAHACAAKAGLDQLIRVLAIEWGPQGIRLNSIAPGPIEDTEGVRRLIAASQDERARVENAIPLRRFGRLEDIANLALFLASPFADYISGTVIPCEGGGGHQALDAASRGAAARMAAAAG